MARSSLINLVGFGIYGVTGFLLIVVITRRLGSEGAGALLQAIAVFSIVSRSAMAGIDVGLVRFNSRFLARARAREIRRLYVISLLPVGVLAAVAGLAVLVLAGPLGELLASGDESAELTSYLRVLAPFIPIASVYQGVESASRGFGTMVPSVVVERIGRSAALPPLVFVAIAAGGGATAVGLAWAGPFAVALVAMAAWTLVLVRRAERALRARIADGSILDPGGDPRDDAPDGEALADDVADLDEITGPTAPAGTGEGGDVPTVVPPPLSHGLLAHRFWRFALPRSFAGVFALTITWVDSLLLGALDGSDAVGVYSASIRWLIVGNVAGNAVTLAFGPQIARVMATRGGEGAKPLFQEATALLVLLAWPAYFTAMVFAPYLLTAFGDDFGGGSAVIVITGIGFLLASAAGPIDMLLLMAGRSSLSLVNTAVALVVNVVANLVLIPPYGIRGAALAWTLSLLVANALPLVQMWRALGIHPWGERTLRALAITGGVGVALAVGRMLLGTTAAGFAVGLVLGGAVLVGGVLTSPDRLGVDQVLPRRSR